MSPDTPFNFIPSDELNPSTDAGAVGGTSQFAGAGAAAASGRDLLGRVAQGAHGTVDRLTETAAPYVQRLQEGLSSATHAVQARAGQLRETGEEWADTLRGKVRAKPLAAVGVAVAVGMLVSRLARR